MKKKKNFTASTLYLESNTLFNFFPQELFHGFHEACFWLEMRLEESLLGLKADLC